VVTHRVWVEWLLVDQGPDEVLTGTLDDWTLHVEINDRRRSVLERVGIEALGDPDPPAPVAVGARAAR
jgi:hypothetical protein